MYPSAGEQVSGSAVRIMTSVLVPTRFYWPHGGRRVSLVGSFTRWVDPIPMSPTEGCPTVFQAIYNLPPGYHQYKFIVDGECRHDEQQPTVTPTFGIVNNIILVTIPELLASPVNQEPFHHGVNMEVDHSVAERVVLLSDDTLKDHCQRVSADNIEVLRRRIADFLSAQTAYDLLPVSGKIVALDISLPVKQAFHVLHEQGFKRSLQYGPIVVIYASYIPHVIGYSWNQTQKLQSRDQQAYNLNEQTFDMEGDYD